MYVTPVLGVVETTTPLMIHILLTLAHLVIMAN
jgi:hypothetical protein